MVKCITDRQRDQLVREIRNGQYEPLLERLHREYPSLPDFVDWDDVVAFMREGTARDPLKDEVLRSILECHAQDHDPRWRTVLLLIFWPGLRSICRRRRQLDVEQDELWQNVVCGFLRAIMALDISHRKNKLVPRIMNAATHRLRDEYGRIRKDLDTVTATDPNELEEIAGASDDSAFSEAEVRVTVGDYMSRLRRHLELGHINEADFQLLIATRVHGKSAAQYAREHGMTLEVARKRRTRAEAAILTPSEGDVKKI
jgi:hypothetical protein